MTTAPFPFVAGQRVPVSPFLSGAPAVSDAVALHREFGTEAALAAQLRAADARSRDNAARFCHWREVERLVGWLGGDEGSATRH